MRIDFFKKFAVSVTAVFLTAGAVSVVGDHFNSEITYGSFIDLRDNTEYRTVEIGTQIWMAENLNYDTLDGTGSWCYENSPDSCDKYGRLYNWAAAINISQQYLTEFWDGGDENQQGICPAGWHLPSHGEWDKLSNFIQDSWSAFDTAGTALKSQTGWQRGSGVPVGKDTYGFSALPGGFRRHEEPYDFLNAGITAGWWSATEYKYSGLTRAHWWLLSRSNEALSHSGIMKTRALSVRCVSNDETSSVIPRTRGSQSRAAIARVYVRNRTLTVQPSSSESAVHIRLIDMRGKSVAKFTASECRGGSMCPPVTFSLANIPAGRYFAEVRGGAKIERISVIAVILTF